MEKIIKEFIQGNKTESEFFELTKDNLMDLREYLIYLTILDEEFEKKTKSQSDSIKKKCDWVKALYFNSLKLHEETDNKMMELVAKDNINIYTVFNKSTDMFEKYYHDLYVYRHSKKKCTLVNQRQEDLILIQSELKESCEIGEEVYKDVKAISKSISGNFDVWASPFDGIFVSTEDDIIASFDKGRSKKSKTYLNDKNKAKILRMVQLENPFNF